MKKRTYLTSILTFVFAFAFLLQNACAKQIRDDVLKNELDCISQHFDTSSTEVTWDDVCYTGDFQNQYQIKRTQLINQTLDMVGNRNKPVYNPRPQQIVILDNQKESDQTLSVSFKPKPSREEIIKKTLDDYYPKMNMLEVGVSMLDYAYQEPSVMNTEGFLFSLAASVTHRTQKNSKIDSIEQIFANGNTLNIYKLEAEVGAGQVDYSSFGTGQMDNNDEFFFELRGILGADAPISNTIFLMPYLGVGYRYLKDDMSGKVTTTGATGYLREQHYLYLPLGMNIVKHLSPKYSLGFNFEYDYLLYGQQQSHLSTTLDFTQKHGFGLRGSFKFIKNMKKTSVFCQPFVRYWNIEDSDVVSGYYEPKNDTTEIGFKLGANF